jgi:RHS repeat-associated protein
VLSAAKEEMLSAFAPWSADECISAFESEGKKPHQGVAGKNPALHQGITWSNSTVALGLRVLAVENRVGSRCTGKERDSESGLDMFGARYYGSSLGRFMTPDWAAKPTNVPYASFGNPQSLNLYSYVNNNPTTTRDPDGHCAEVLSCTIEFGAGGSFFGPGGTIVGGIIGAAVGGAIVYYGGKAAINYFHSSDNSNAAPAPASGTQAGTQPKDVYIDPNKYPGSAGHAADAQAAGKPDVLTVDRPGKSDNRSDAMAGHPAQPGTDRDEYPPAVTREGGAGASVRNIDPSDNRGAGASLGNQIRDVPNGGQIRVIPQPPPPPPPKPEPQSN